MADTPAPATGALLDDVLTLARLERLGWEADLKMLRASGLPLMAGDGGDGGSGAGDGGGQGGSGDSSGAGAGDGGSGGGSGDGGAGDEANLDDAGKRALAAERKARRDAERRASDAERKAKEFEERDLTAQQKLEKRAAEAESKVPTLEGENLRLRVALEKGLTGDRAILIDRLRGSTKEELAADADELLKHFGGGGSGGNGGGSGFDGGARGGAPVTDMDTLIRQRAGYA